jgi:acyl-CoA synthetase (NDP forming)
MRPNAPTEEPTQGDARSPVVVRALREGRAALDEREAKALLAAYEIGTPLGTVVHSAQEAARAVEALGRRAVLKALGPDIQHKSDAGLVDLDVHDADAARTAYHRLVDRGAGRATGGVLVEEWVPHEREFLVGMRRDEQFGPVVAFGLGGIFTEAVADVSFALPPLDDQACAEMVDGLRTRQLLGPVRGLPRVDTARLTQIIRAIARMAGDNPEIAEIDVNPLLVAGGDLVAADALVILRPLAVNGESRRAGGREAGVADGESAPAAATRRRRDLEAVFAPRSVAVIGASEDPTKWGGSVLRNLLDGGFGGALYPLNGRGGSVLGLPAYAALADLPETPDLAIVALGGVHAAQVVADAGRLGIRAAIVIAAGFGEAGREGEALQQRLAAEAADGGLTMVGPNCMGVLCTSARLAAIGFVTLRPDAGPLSVISQSGNIGTQLLMSAERRGVGVEKFVSSGNQAATDANDFLEYLADDPATGVVIMYLEGAGDGRRLFDLARTTTPRKPVIVLRGGLSAEGRRAASSHTGALAGSAEVFAAAARQARVITAADPDEALDVAAVLAYLPRPAGPRVAVVTLGGGWGVLAADALAAQGLRLAELPPDVLAAVGEYLPPFWSHGNPVDLVATVAHGVPERVIELVAGSAAVDVVLTLALFGSPSSGRAGQDRADAAPADAPFPELNDRERALLTHIAAVMDATGKPVISVPLTPLDRSVFPGLGGFAPVLLPTPSAAVRALAAATWYATRVGATAAAGPPRR